MKKAIQISKSFSLDNKVLVHFEDRILTIMKAWVVVKKIHASPHDLKVLRQTQQKVAREALTHALELSGLDFPTLSFDEKGAPIPLNGVYVSMTHQRLFAAAVVAPCAVGIDLATIEPRKDPKVWQQITTEDEIKQAGFDKTWASFHRIWAAKEAVLKAKGVGLVGRKHCKLKHHVSNSPDQMTLQLMYENESWCVLENTFSNHVLAVAWPQDVALHITVQHVESIFER